MAERVLQTTATIPAGTLASAPVTVALGVDNFEIERIDLEVPPGGAGNVGFYLANNGHPWIPRTVGEWLVWDDRVETFYPTGYPTAGGWQITGYNTGVYAHAVIARFHVNPPAGQDAPIRPLTLTFIERDIRPYEPVVL